MDLCDLPNGYAATVIDEATRYSWIAFLQRKSDTAVEVQHFLTWFETHMDLRVQCVRHDQGGRIHERQVARIL
jgi:hypothetical protein